MSDEPAGSDRPVAPVEVGRRRWAARGLLWSLMVLVLSAFVAAATVRIPETVSSPFVLVPLRGVDALRTPRDGSVSEVRIAEGAAVTRDEVLLVIRSPEIRDQAAELGSLETQVQSATEALVNARRRYESQRRADEEDARRLKTRRAQLAQQIESQRALRGSLGARYRASLAIADNDVVRLGGDLEFKRNHLVLAREIAERHRDGYERGFLGWVEYIRPKIEAEKIASEVQQLEREIDAARLRVVRLKAEREKEETEWTTTMEQLEAELAMVRAGIEKLEHEVVTRRVEHRDTERRLQEDTAKAQIRMTALREALTHARGSQFSVLAPCAGSVLRLVVERAGAVVRAGDVLIEVACAGEKLQAELMLPQSGASTVRPGQPVKLLYDAFPYQRYGARPGTIRWVSPGGVTAKDGRAFRAFADLAEESVQVDGQARTLAPGMAGRADVVVGRRPALSYVFEPLRRLREDLDAPAPRR